LSILIDYLNVERDIAFRPVIRKLIRSLIIEEGKELGEISIIFTSNQEIFEINRKFLNHHYYTDVITFPEVKKGKLSGDIYISLEQVRINAQTYKTNFHDEVTRVIIHGVLHLIGFNDITDIEKKLMQKLEDHYLCRFKKFDLIAR
jgi:rRNA maturation RNase YbeY